MLTPPSRARRLAAMALTLAVAFPVPGIAMAGSRQTAEPPSAETDASPSTEAAPADVPRPAETTDSPSTEAAPAEIPPPHEPDPPAADAAARSTPSPADDPLRKLSPEELEFRQQEARIQDARKHYTQGNRLFGKKRYAAAAEEYEQSYAAAPAARTLYSIALSYEYAGRPVEAVEAIERYLGLPECTDLPEAERTIECTDQRADAQKILSGQRRLVGELRLDLAVGVDLREIRVAGRTVPRVDFPLLLLPGSVDVELFGVHPDQRRRWVVNIAAGEPYTLYVAPFDTAEVGGPTPPTPEDPELDRLQRERRRQRLRTSFWVGTGLTAMSGIALAVMGSLTLYEQRRFNTEKCRMDCLDPDTGEPRGTGYPLDHEERFLRYKPITNAMVGVTVGLAVGTALVGVFAFGKRNEPVPNDRAQVRLTGSGLLVRW